jgi:leader peptidase (prepilin peptidase) / N-methyltransferase
MLITFLSFAGGLALGSFANVCIVRLPADLSLWRPRSHCPNCQSPIAWHDNIPVVSYLWLRARCRGCHHSISLDYPVVEGLMGLLFAGVALLYKEDPIRMSAVQLLIFYALTISIIDFRHRIIPDELSLSLLGIGVGLTVARVNPFIHTTYWTGVLECLGAIVGGGGLMWSLAWAGEKIFKKEALGGGDIKLVAAFGACMGWRGVVAPLLIGSLLGGTLGLVLILLKKKKLGETIPFGPFLCAGVLVASILPPDSSFFIFP